MRQKLEEYNLACLVSLAEAAGITGEAWPDDLAAESLAHLRRYLELCKDVGNMWESIRGDSNLRWLLERHPNEVAQLALELQPATAAGIAGHWGP